MTKIVVSILKKISKEMLVGIVVTVISIIITAISIRQTGKKTSKKATAPTKL